MRKLVFRQEKKERKHIYRKKEEKKLGGRQKMSGKSSHFLYTLYIHLTSHQTNTDYISPKSQVASL